MSVWLTIPSARPVAEAEPVLAKWRAQGYKIALFRDEPFDIKCEASIIGAYPGYAKATNELIHFVLALDSEAQYCIVGGDDIEPDPHHTAEEIEADCNAWFHFYWNEQGLSAFRKRGFTPIPEATTAMAKVMHTFGVMQPTGDRWGENPSHPDPRLRSAYIDRVCGSAWLGREFCRRMYQGNGPLWPEFYHMFVDEHLQAVAEKLGILWQRPDLIHLHRHWGRKEGATMADIPEFLEGVNTPEHWAESKAIFDRLRAGGFAEADDLLP